MQLNIIIDLFSPVFCFFVSFIDIAIHSYLLPDKNRNTKQKTPVVKRSLNPVWNYTFTYDDVSLNELSERALELTIWDHDRLASNEFLGGVRFSLGTGNQHEIRFLLFTLFCFFFYAFFMTFQF